MKGLVDDEQLNFLKEISVSSLVELTDIEKKTFWINIYNAFIQIELKGMKGAAVDKSIFSKKIINIAGQKLSFDKIEHGILRRSLWKYGLGFLSSQYLTRETKNWRTKMLDPRIHFQLNCGAVSCPMIRLLTIENIEAELEFGESDFVTGESEIQNDKIMLSSLFLFYLKDFGGRRGVKALVKKYYPEENYKLSFKKFDWTKNPKKIKTLV